MKINKHGKKFTEEKTESFKCERCGCEFSAKEDEYYVDVCAGDNFPPGGSLTLPAVSVDYHVCSCPECHKIVKNKHERQNFTPYTLTGSDFATAKSDQNVTVSAWSATGTRDDSLDACTSVSVSEINKAMSEINKE